MRSWWFRRIIAAGAIVAMASVYPGMAEAADRPAVSVTLPATGERQELTTVSGSILTGRVLSVGDSTITFESDVGSLIIPLNAIAELRTFSGTAPKKYISASTDPNRTRLLFAPTGHMLAKGDGYLADYYIFFPAVNYGITDRISLGGGMSLFPTGNMSDQVYFLTPKIALRRTKHFAAAAGAMIIRIPGFDDEEGSPKLSVLYGVGTWGGPDRDVTLGIGYGMVGNEFADRPLIILGGRSRLGRRTALITENWMVPGVDDVLISYGMRFFTGNISVDLALINTLGEDALFPGVPYVDFVWHF